MVRVLTSTTSHKREAILPTLDVLAALGLRDLDVNLHHVIELGTPIDAIGTAAVRNGQRIWVLSGGWCDFFHRPPEIEDTFRSVARQVVLAGAVGVTVLRLFFGRLERERYSVDALSTISANLQRLADLHHDMTFVFENHDGASLDPHVCAEILQRADRPTLRMNFDPINFAKAGVPLPAAFEACLPFIGHLHLKGLEAGEYCEFGLGDVDLTPMLERLAAARYAGRFSVDYEGRFDGTLRLYQSVQRARAITERFFPG